jgi:post-segregation antitoxin (ccd killing protein)
MRYSCQRQNTTISLSIRRDLLKAARLSKIDVSAALEQALVDSIK